MDEEQLTADESSEGTSASGAPVTPRSTRSKGVPAWLKIGAVFLVLGGGVSVLLWGTEASDAFVYSKLVNEVMDEPDRYVGRELRVEGQLEQGSVHFESEPTCEHTFVLTKEGQQMPVRFPRCVVPDTFRDDLDLDVVVQGQLQANGTFLADQVIPRCPSKYEMRQRKQNGEQMPHGAMGAGAGETS